MAMQEIRFNNCVDTDLISSLELSYKFEDSTGYNNRLYLRVSNIPIFCGALQLHDFVGSITLNWKEVDVDDFMDGLISKASHVYDLNPGMYFIWWDRYDGYGSRLAEVLGAKKEMCFLNPNSDNEVAMYSLEVPNHPAIDPENYDEDYF